MSGDAGLLPCPFCGGEATVIGRRGGAGCKTCFLGRGTVAEWNTRHPHELRAAAQAVVNAWGENAARVFEAMGDDNPRVNRIDAAVLELIDALNRRSPSAEGAATALVNEQAEDPGLWCPASTASEAYLQRALRRLHAVIESSTPGPSAEGERAPTRDEVLEEAARACEPPCGEQCGHGQCAGKRWAAWTIRKLKAQPRG